MESDYEEKSIRVVRGIILKYFANNENQIFLSWNCFRFAGRESQYFDPGNYSYPEANRTFI